MCTAVILGISTLKIVVKDLGSIQPTDFAGGVNNFLFCNRKFRVLTILVRLILHLKIVNFYTQSCYKLTFKTILIFGVTKYHLFRCTNTF